MDVCSSSFPRFVVDITDARYGNQSMRWEAWLGEIATPAGEYMLGWVAEAEVDGGTVEGSPGCKEEMEVDDVFTFAEADVCGGTSGFKAIVQVDSGAENMEASQPYGGDGEGGAVRVAGSSEEDGEAVAEGVSGVQGSESAKVITITITIQVT